jgi:hypothetical protein
VNKEISDRFSIKAGNFLIGFSRRNSSIGIVTRLRAGRSGSRVRFPAGRLGIFLFTTASRPALGPTHPPIDTRGSFPGGKAAEDMKLTNHLHLVPRSRMRGAIPPLPNTSLWRGA